MDIKKKILYSVVPTIVIILTVIHLSRPAGIFNLTFFIAINAAVLVQVALLFREMKINRIEVGRRILYIFLLISFLPFHYILIWGILKEK
ncbi:MAG: hypothetical protein R2830_14225 [Saprospiraceae bacterium]